MATRRIILHCSKLALGCWSCVVTATACSDSTKTSSSTNSDAASTVVGNKPSDAGLEAVAKPSDAGPQAVAMRGERPVVGPPIRTVETTTAANSNTASLPVEHCSPTKSTRPPQQLTGRLSNVDRKSSRTAIKPSAFLAAGRNRSSFVHVGGDIWRVVLNGETCDIEIEIADARAGKGSARIIAGIPPYAQYWRIRREIDQEVFRHSGQHIDAGQPVDLVTPIWIGVAGIASSYPQSRRGVYPVSAVQFECRVGNIPLIQCEGIP